MELHPEQPVLCIFLYFQPFCFWKSFQDHDIYRLICPQIEGFPIRKNQFLRPDLRLSMFCKSVQHHIIFFCLPIFSPAHRIRDTVHNELLRLIHRTVSGLKGEHHRLIPAEPVCLNPVSGFYLHTAKTELIIYVKLYFFAY